MDVTDKTFKKEVIDKSEEIPVLVDFWASWCAPCLMLKPVIEDVAKEFKGKMILAEANTSECYEQSQKYGVRAIPNVKLFKKGKVVAEIMGFRPKQEIIDWLKTNL